MVDWDERYRSGSHAPTAPSELLVKAIESLPPGRALDLACGAGRHAIYLAERGWQVTAVDSSREGVELAQLRARELGMMFETVVADLERNEFVIQPGSYDLIGVFYYLQRDLFPAIRAGVRAGGTVVAAIHIRDDDPVSPEGNPAFLLERGQLRSEFAGWEIGFYREGRSQETGHKHRSAEIIARRPARKHKSQI